jgi:hypothetical protein
MSRYTYTIDEDNAVSIFDSERPTENGAPNVYQPWHPAAPEQPWTRAEAEAWATETIANYALPPVEGPAPVVVPEIPTE